METMPNAPLDLDLIIERADKTDKPKYPPYSSENPEWRQKVYDSGLVLPGMTGYWTVKRKEYKLN